MLLESNTRKTSRPSSTASKSQEYKLFNLTGKPIKRSNSWRTKFENHKLETIYFQQKIPRYFTKNYDRFFISWHFCIKFGCLSAIPKSWSMGFSAQIALWNITVCNMHSGHQIIWWPYIYMHLWNAEKTTKVT